MSEENVILGKEARNKFDDTKGDLYIRHETLSSLKNFSKIEDTSETVGRIRRNESRYNKEFVPNHIPVIEMYRAKDSGNPPIYKDNSDKMSYYKTTLDFHTHPKYIDSHLSSRQDCSSFISDKNNAGKIFQGILSNGEMTIYDLSNVKRDDSNKCENVDDICECLRKKGMKMRNIDKGQDLLLKRIHHKEK